MSIRQKKSGFLADISHAGTRYRKQFNTDAEAHEWEASLRKRFTLGQPVGDLLGGRSADGMTLRELLDETFRMSWQGSRNERHQIVNMRQIEAHFGDACLVSTITTESVDGFIRALEARGIAPATINSRLSTLSKALTFGADRGYITNRPKITRKKVGNNARIRFLSELEEQRIINVLEEDGRHDFACFFKWSIDTGMRPIESRFIPQTAVRLDPELGHLVDMRRTKNSYPRTIPLTAKALDAFNLLCDEPMPFARFTEGSIRSNWKYVRERLGETDPEFVFYLTRHTCASRLVQRNVPLQIIKEWMGHKTFEMTMRYAKLSPKNMLDAKAALEQDS